MLTRKMKIGPSIYKVDYLKVVPVMESGHELNGSINYDQKLVNLRSGLSAQMKAEGLLHEAFHGIAFDRSVDLDEEDVTQLTRGWLAFIIDNPKIMGTKFLDIWKE